MCNALPVAIKCTVINNFQVRKNYGAAHIRCQNYSVCIWINWATPQTVISDLVQILQARGDYWDPLHISLILKAPNFAMNSLPEKVQGL